MKGLFLCVGLALLGIQLASADCGVENIIVHDTFDSAEEFSIIVTVNGSAISGLYFGHCRFWSPPMMVTVTSSSLGDPTDGCDTWRVDLDILYFVSTCGAVFDPEGLYYLPMNYSDSSSGYHSRALFWKANATQTPDICGNSDGYTFLLGGGADLTKGFLWFNMIVAIPRVIQSDSYDLSVRGINSGDPCLIMDNQILPRRFIITNSSYELINPYTIGTCAVLKFALSIPRMVENCGFDVSGELYELTLYVPGVTAPRDFTLSTIGAYTGTSYPYAGFVNEPLPLDPSMSPSNAPTGSPTGTPSVSPTNFPTVSPTGAPSISPTNSPTGSPTDYICGDGSVRYRDDLSSLDALGTLEFVFEAMVNQFDTIDIKFKDGCQFSLLTPTLNHWESVTDPAFGCYHITLTVSLTEAISSCGFQVSTSNFDTATVLSTPQIITTRASLVGGEIIVSESTTNVQIVLLLEMAFSVTTNSTTIIGSILLESGITASILDLSTEEMTIQFLTSADQPYALNGSLITQSVVPGWILVSFEEGTSSLPCLDGSPCFQVWTMVVKRPQTCFESSPQDLEGSFSLPFQITCRPYFTGSCEPSPPNITISFTTSSDNYCTRVLDTIELDGSLALYLESEGMTVLDSYIYGTRAHAIADINSDVQMSHAHLESAVISDGTNTITLYLDPHTSLSYFSSEGSSADFLGFDLDQGVLLQVENDIDYSGSFRVRASWTWGALTAPLSAVSGTSEITVVFNVRVLFTTVSGRRRRLLSLHSQPVSDTSVSSMVGVARTETDLITSGFTPNDSMLSSVALPCQDAEIVKQKWFSDGGVALMLTFCILMFILGVVSDRICYHKSRKEEAVSEEEDVDPFHSIPGADMPSLRA